MRQTRTFRVMINKNGNITYTSVSVESPAGLSQARELAERMYGGPGIYINILA